MSATESFGAPIIAIEYPFYRAIGAKFVVTDICHESGQGVADDFTHSVGEPSCPSPTASPRQTCKKVSKPANVPLRFQMLRRSECLMTGRQGRFSLGAMSVADFHEQFIALLTDLGATPEFHGRPNELPEPTPFAKDHLERPYDAKAVTRFFRASVAVDRVMKLFRTSYLGKVSPVHLFWGNFDLAVTRFSGRPAPLHQDGIPGLPDDVSCEAYSHQVSSAGFWPGGAGVDFPAFYSYAYPAPPDFADAQVKPERAYFDTNLGEFLLPYDAVRSSRDPEATLMAFLESTYQAAADLGAWDRSALECATVFHRPQHPGPSRTPSSRASTVR